MGGGDYSVHFPVLSPHFWIAAGANLRGVAGAAIGMMYIR